MRENILPKDQSAWIFILAAVLALFFEISATTLPLIIGVFVLTAVIFRKNWVFAAAFLVGLIFDILTFRAVGTTSAFLIFLIFLIFLYENKFEIETLPFVFVSTFLSSFAFLIFLGYGNLLPQAFLVSLVTSIFFQFLSASWHDKIER